MGKGPMDGLRADIVKQDEETTLNILMIESACMGNGKVTNRGTVTVIIRNKRKW